MTPTYSYRRVREGRQTVMRPTTVTLEVGAEKDSRDNQIRAALRSGRTQTEIARHFGIGQQQVSRIARKLRSGSAS